MSDVGFTPLVPEAAADSWQQSLDPRLFVRLARPLTEPCVLLSTELSRRVLKAVEEMHVRMSLSGDVLRRRATVHGYESGQLPIVDAQWAAGPGPAEDQAAPPRERLVVQAAMAPPVAFAAPVVQPRELQIARETVARQEPAELSPPTAPVLPPALLPAPSAGAPPCLGSSVDAPAPPARVRPANLRPLRVDASEPGASASASAPQQAVGPVYPSRPSEFGAALQPVAVAAAMRADGLRSSAVAIVTPPSSPSARKTTAQIDAAAGLADRAPVVRAAARRRDQDGLPAVAIPPHGRAVQVRTDPPAAGVNSAPLVHTSAGERSATPEAAGGANQASAARAEGFRAKAPPASEVQPRPPKAALPPPPRAPAAPELNIDELAEKVQRKIIRQLADDRIRRGQLR